LIDMNAQDSWSIFKDKLHSLVKEFVPTKSQCVARKKPLWMTHIKP